MFSRGRQGWEALLSRCLSFGAGVEAPGGSEDPGRERLALSVPPPSLAHHQLREENRSPESGVRCPGSHSRWDSTSWTLLISLAPSSSWATGVRPGVPLGALGLGSGKPMSPSSVNKTPRLWSSAPFLGIGGRLLRAWQPAHIPTSLPMPQFTPGEGSAAAARDVTKIPPITLPTAATQADPVFRSECDPMKLLPPALSVLSLRADNPKSQGWPSPSSHPFSTDKETETEESALAKVDKGAGGVQLR